MARKLTRRHLIASIAAVTATLPLLQACQQPPAATPTSGGSAAQPTAAATAASSGQPTAAAGTATPAQATKPQAAAVTLTFTEPPTPESLAKAQEILNAPNITVETVSHQDYLNRLKVQFAAGTGTDLFRMNVPSGKFWMNRGVMLSLEDWKKANPQFAENITTLVPSTVTSYTWNGELRGVPFSSETTLGYYNIDLFEKAGVPTPQELGDNYDWNTQLEMFQKLTSGSGRDKVYATMVNGHTQSGSAEFIYAAGARIISDDGMTAMCGSPEMIEAVQWIVDLIYTHEVSAEPDSFGKDTGLNFFAAFHNWRTAYANSGEWAWWVFRDEQLPDKKFRIGFTEPPKHPKTGKRGAQGHTLCVAVYSQTRYRDEAASLAMAFSEKDVQALIAPKWLPARIDAQDNFFQGEGGAEIKPIVEATQQYAVPYPASAAEEAAVNVFWTHLKNIFLKQEEVEAGLKAAEKEINDAIQKAGAGR